MSNIGNSEIIRYVTRHYLETHLGARISDVAKALTTSPAKVRKVCEEMDFDFYEETFPSGAFSNFTGRTVLSPCVEPSKRYLASLVLKAQKC